MENPFEYRECESPAERSIPTYHKPAPVLQDLLSLGMFVVGLWCGFCCIGPAFVGISRGEWLLFSVTTIALGYGLHRDSWMSLVGTLMLFTLLLIKPMIVYLRFQLTEPWYDYALPLTGIVVSGWLIWNYRKRYRH